MGGARDARPTPSRVVRMARGSASAAMILILPPHAGHSVTCDTPNQEVGLLRAGIHAEDPCKEAGPGEAVDRLRRHGPLVVRAGLCGFFGPPRHNAVAIGGIRNPGA